MEDSERKAFKKLLVKTAMIYDRDPLDPQQADSYWFSLRAYQFRLIRWAINNHYRSPRHGYIFPRVADIVREIESILSNHRKSEQPEHQALPPPPPAVGPRQIGEEIQGMIDRLHAKCTEEIQVIPDEATQRRLEFERRLRHENPNWRRKKITFTPIGTALNAVVIREEKPT